MKQTILVTGGTGFIGSHTTVELQNAGYKVVIVDNLSNSQASVVDGIEKITGVRPAFEQADCRDMEAMDGVFAKYPDIQGIIHFAASKAVGESVEKPLLYYRNNIVSLLNLLELMPKHGVKGIIFSSSCTVYGQPDPEHLPVTEDAPIKPAESPYGNTKQVNEEIIRDYIKSGADIKAILLRYFNPIGSHPSAIIGEMPTGVPMNLIPYVTQNLAKAHVKAMERVLDTDSDRLEVFNVGTGHGVSTKQIIDAFEKATGVKLNWAYAPRRAGDIEKVWANPEKANKVLGWKAETSLEDTLKSAWNWQKHLREEGIQ